MKRVEEQTEALPSITWVTLDKGVNMDARACAPCIKHHCIEDTAVVCWAAEAGKNAPDVVGQIQKRGLDLSSAQPCDGEQDQL